MVPDRTLPWKMTGTGTYSSFSQGQRVNVLCKLKMTYETEMITVKVWHIQVPPSLITKSR